MTTMVSPQRLLSGPPLHAGAESLNAHRLRLGPRPVHKDAEMIGLLEASGLQGRGGAGFPVARKWRSVKDRAAGRAVVLVNGAEGEPLSLKDRSLMAARPHLVIDGALLAAEAVDADDIIFYVGVAHGSAQAGLQRALAERQGEPGRRRLRLSKAPTGYVSGEETAAIHFVNDGVALPVSTPPRPFERGIGGRPTLVQNVESLALAALIGRYGPAWYRQLGRHNAIGTGLLTVSGVTPRPALLEVDLGTTVSEVAASAGVRRDSSEAVLLGGYFGGWAHLDDAWHAPLDHLALRARGLALGCGVVSFLPADACGVAATARIVGYLATQSARQCGPCVFGLGAIAKAADRLAATAAFGDDLARLTLWGRELRGRGGCHHPDGAVGLLQSAMDVFAEEFAAHERGHCRRVLQTAGAA
jgi:NADH:ubiquinone oxidoreductase subunit F (NADH-binding)